jgi:hypothetical protein
MMCDLFQSLFSSNTCLTENELNLSNAKPYWQPAKEYSDVEMGKTGEKSACHHAIKYSELSDELV